VTFFGMQVMYPDLTPTQIQALDKYMHLWVDLQQGSGLDTRWGGYWPAGQAGVVALYFLGPRAEAERTLLTKVDAWYAGLDPNVSQWIGYMLEESPSFFRPKELV